MASEYLIRGLSDLVELFAALKEEKYPFRLIFKSGKKRSINQNSLYWKWLGIMATKYKQDSPEDMHYLMRHKFLGYEEKRIGKTVISNQLKSTTKLDKGEMFYYMEQINSWSAENSLLLPIPEESEYKDILDRQNA